MAPAVEQLKPAVSSLSLNERAELAAYLIDSLDSTVDPGADSAWEDELAVRRREILAGTVEGQPAESVFENIRRKHM
jgi:putative addiction module component (TIGR02574 family)